jgi:hypothetical protein
MEGIENNKSITIQRNISQNEENEMKANPKS